MKATDHFKCTIQAKFERQGSRRRTLCGKLSQGGKEHRRLHYLYPQLCEKQRMRRFFRRRNIFSGSALLSSLQDYPKPIMISIDY